jgi:hypothetical protein
LAEMGGELLVAAPVGHHEAHHCPLSLRLDRWRLQGPARWRAGVPPRAGAHRTCPSRSRS